ncbi:hypothetical protein [Pseudomonas sp. SCA2728.1_7]|uniref:hypothetical protein n=1 Tax=Pseudomonas sp. SCA2728.1_7 TaxID=2825975 RepID=UPI001BB084CE|nr:hypothetical protein [Pseudomonas sp. SCA2728.1_7]QUE91265.1 hypothetical protein KBP52_02120 [Pseudomonas sp. SCA2728.1_7]
MLSGKIKATFEVPSPDDAEAGSRPFIQLYTLDLVDAAIEHGVPDDSPLTNLLHAAGGELDVQELLENHVMSYVPSSRPAAADEVAEWLEALAAMFRSSSEHLSLDLKPRVSHGPRQ